MTGPLDFRQALQAFFNGDLTFPALQEAIRETVQREPFRGTEIIGTLDQLLGEGRLPPQLHAALRTQVATPTMPPNAPAGPPQQPPAAGPPSASQPPGTPPAGTNQPGPPPHGPQPPGGHSPAPQPPTGAPTGSRPAGPAAIPPGPAAEDQG
ncbi:MAG: hypothetical protein KJO55_08005, partial [Gammaproteobacteria bacterium]|nr:hypothetical protein [Gammaproteobacteria bacterium]